MEQMHKYPAKSVPPRDRTTHLGPRFWRKRGTLMSEDSGTAGATPVRARRAAAALEGKAYGPQAVAAVQAALGEDLDPAPDLYHSRATKLHLARVLTGRALAALVQ